MGVGKDKKDTSKGKGKDSDEGMGVAPAEPGAQPRRRRRGRAAAATPAVDPEFDDSWADGASAAPPARLLALSLSAAAGDEVVPPLEGAAVRGRRELVATHSGPRSPRRKSARPVDAAAAAAAAEPLPLALLAGRVATVKGLVSRPDLENVLVVLDVQDMTSGRWICRTKGGEQLRILPKKLTPIAETGQKFLRLRYDAS